jgi:hypothetical protein
MKDHRITVEEYTNMWYELEGGRVTEREWIEFCYIVFKQQLEDNKDVMIRLKNR